MALRFPRFSLGLAQDPTTRRIWFGIATAHDFESHDDITEERLYQNIFASHFGAVSNNLSVDVRKSVSCSLARKF